LKTNTISGVRRIQFIAVTTPFQPINLINQIQERKVKISYQLTTTTEINPAIPEPFYNPTREYDEGDTSLLESRRTSYTTTKRILLLISSDGGADTSLYGEERGM
jgi:hypothetical protein